MEQNQYPPGNGMVELRKGVADHANCFYGMDVDPDRGVLATAGGTEAVLSVDLGFG